MWLLLHHNSYFFSASLCWDWNQHLFVTISYPCKLSLTNSQNYIFCTWRHPTIFPVKPSMLLATADSTECRSFTGGSLCLGDCDPSSCFTSISWLPQLFLGNHTLASITIAHWRGIFYGFYFLFFTQARPPDYTSNSGLFLACKYGWSLTCLLPAHHSHSFSFGRCWCPS